MSSNNPRGDCPDHSTGVSRPIGLGVVATGTGASAGGCAHHSVSRPAHVGSPIVVRLAAAAIVTAFGVIARFVAGPRAAAMTAVVGVVVAVVVLSEAA